MRGGRRSEEVSSIECLTFISNAYFCFFIPFHLINSSSLFRLKSTESLRNL